MFKLPEINFTMMRFLSDETLQYHYGKHHQAYIDNLNSLTKNLPNKDLVEIISDSDGSLYDNAAQAWNHTFYWLGLSPGPHYLSSNSALSNAIANSFPSDIKLKELFQASAMKLVGSGWTWLAFNRASYSLEIVNTNNTATIDLKKYMPLLTCDVWEHAYYIEYRNSRANYLTDFWGAINWKFVEENFESKDLNKVTRLIG